VQKSTFTSPPVIVLHRDFLSPHKPPSKKRDLDVFATTSFLSRPTASYFKIRNFLFPWVAQDQREFLELMPGKVSSTFKLSLSILQQVRRVRNWYQNNQRHRAKTCVEFKHIAALRIIRIFNFLSIYTTRYFLQLGPYSTSASLN